MPKSVGWIACRVVSRRHATSGIWALLAALGTAEGRQRRILLYAFARLAYHRSGDGDLRDRMIEA